MNKRPIFLSASIPYGERTAHYHPDPIAIRDAVRALVAEGLPDRMLVFGGHPAISPLVWEASKSLHAIDRIVIYQSELYRSSVPKEAAYFPNLVWTKAVGQDCDASLGHMRRLMIQLRTDEQEKLSIAEYAVAFFIGGMDGVEDEWDRFRQAYPSAPAFPVDSTEGAAQLLAKANQGYLESLGRAVVPALQNELSYRTLFRRLLHDLP